MRQRNEAAGGHVDHRLHCGDFPMGGLIYLVGLIVVILAILSFLGLH
ncbi:MAG TPA: hypothetical protein VKR31_06660 [Rhizomicrobium sp.]|nr:hypothetical protein [Rhizomicrobium sp.]